MLILTVSYRCHAVSLAGVQQLILRVTQCGVRVAVPGMYLVVYAVSLYDCSQVSIGTG